MYEETKIHRVLDQWGDRNTSWKGGRARSTIERLTKRILVEANRDLFLCERCGKRGSSQEWPRHHKDRNRTNNTLENLEVLCHACHNREHNRTRRRTNGRFA